jgi:hypothetical protein
MESLVKDSRRSPLPPISPLFFHLATQVHSKSLTGKSVMREVMKSKRDDDDDGGGGGRRRLGCDWVAGLIRHPSDKTSNQSTNSTPGLNFGKRIQSRIGFLRVIILYPSFNEAASAPGALAPLTAEEGSLCCTFVGCFLSPSTTCYAGKYDAEEKSRPGPPHKAECKVANVRILFVRFEVITSYHVGSAVRSISVQSFGISGKATSRH